MKARAGLRALVSAGALIAATLNWGVAHATPTNNDFSGATTIASLPFAGWVDTTGATTEDGEPGVFDACAAAGASVWYRYDSASTERLAANTAGSDFDAFVGVYEGSALNDLRLVACKHKPFFTVEAGKTYYFQIGGADVDQSGNVVPLWGLAQFSLEQHAPVPEPCAACPTFRNYHVPDDVFSFAHRAGETSIGNNPKTNATLFLMLTHVLRATWDDVTDEITWKQVDGVTTATSTNDPILYTDPTTGRTWVVQLRVAGAVGASIIEYTDNDGATWNEAEPAQVNPSWDHESLGAGPYPAPLRDLNPVYSNAVYYCAQLGFPFSQCHRSDDGGITWGAPLPMNLLNCGGLHGHIAVDPHDGTVYVPHYDCGSSQGIIYSADAGNTWAFRPVSGVKPPGAGLVDPKVAFDRGNRMYFTGSSAGTPVATTSIDGGKTWTKIADLGTEFGIQNTKFPMVVAGDAGRAAVAFYGNQEGGNDQTDVFSDEWHLYVSFTYDGGTTWKTVDATPDDPVQRGCIWMQGGGNPCRNLLDFQDMTMDAQGRVIVGYADGCTNDACRGIYGAAIDSRDSQGVIARQNTGKGLLAGYDGTF